MFRVLLGLICSMSYCKTLLTVHMSIQMKGKKVEGRGLSPLRLLYVFSGCLEEIEQKQKEREINSSLFINATS